MQTVFKQQEFNNLGKTLNGYRVSWSELALFIFKVSITTFFALFLISKSFAEELDDKALQLVKLDQIKAGQLLFNSEQQGIYTPSLLLDSDVEFKVSGLIAHVSLKQTFKNDSAYFVEGVYVFPLPENAAVNRMRMVIGERIIHGEIKEKQQARLIYQQAKSEGKKASLVEQQRPNMFTNKVANIAPDETITVELDYVQSINYQDETFSLRFPMTITPRYIPGIPLEQSETEFVVGEMSWGVDTDQVADASLITPLLDPLAASEQHRINPISIRASLDMGMKLSNVNSPYHEIKVTQKGGIYSLALTQGKVSMEQDFVLEWKPELGKEPRVAVFSEQIDGHDYALLMVLPPQQQSLSKSLPKEIVYIVDTSGSMGGVSIEQARQSLLLALDRLKPQDKFNIIEFNSSTKPLHQSAVIASSDNLQSAKHFVKNLSAGGGTEMFSALSFALNEQPEEGFVRQLVFITDGAVGNEQALFKLIHEKLGANRLFTVGIGSAPNSYFMRDAAKFGRGTHTHIGDIAEVQQKMSLLFSKLENPVAKNITVSWPDNRDLEVYPKRIPDLYQGEPLLLSAKLQDIRGKLLIEGDTASKHWSRKLNIKESADNQGVATLWARQKITNLTNMLVQGVAESEVKPKVIEVALRHQLLSKYTSFVAVEQQVSRPAEELLKSTAITNARPKGQSPQQFAYPKTAAGITEKLMYGLIMLFFSLVLSLTNRYEQALLEKQSGKYGS